MKVAVLGSGTVAQTLALGFRKHGYQVRVGNRDIGKLGDFSKKSGIAVSSLAEASAWADLIVLAVLGRAAEAALHQTGEANLAGKIVIDTTNPIAEDPPQQGVLQFFTGPNDSLMERLQAAFLAARFVKAFNSVGNAFMVNPSFPGGKPTMFYCGNDVAAKQTVAKIIEQFGWEPADMGSAASARALEPLCQLWCLPGFLQNQWTHAFKLLRL